MYCNYVVIKGLPRYFNEHPSITEFNIPALSRCVDTGPFVKCTLFLPNKFDRE